jgi:serine/threonine-protein kinase
MADSHLSPRAAMSIALNDLSELTSEEWSAREAILQRFDQAWRRGPRPILEEWLPHEPVARRVLLVELVQTDLEYRLKDGEPARVEEYLDRFPELRSDPEAEIALVAAELSWRRRREPSLVLDEFRQRFPDLPRELLETARIARTLRVAVPPPLAVEPPGTLLGKYELIEEVGRGAFGVVYCARDQELDRIVALKVLRAGLTGSQEEQDRFLREARSAAQLKHPHIVTLHEAVQSGERCYLACEFVAGMTLAERIVTGRPSFRESAALVATVAEALDYAHRQGVIHRDVKPSNILLDQHGEPHLTDFGLALRSSGELTLTREGEVLGTPAYMPPEQAQGQGHRVDGRGDLYSVGVILYELLTGELPFRGNREMVLRQLLEEEPPPPRRLDHLIPRDLETICLKCLAKEPARRYADAGALALDLRRFLACEPIQARPAGRLERLARWCRRKPVLAGLSAALVLALSLGFTGVTTQWLSARRESSRAEKNFRIARQNVADYLMIVSKDPRLRRDLPGLQALRADLIGKALGYYREFLRTSGGDPGLQEEVADAYGKATLALSELGRFPEAMESCREALVMLRGLSSTRPDDTRLRRELAETQLQFGTLQRATGRLVDAEASYNSAAEILRGLVATQTQLAEYENLLARAYLNLGVLQDDLGRKDDSERSYLLALDRRRRLHADYPEVSGYQLDLARTHTDLGFLQDSVGRDVDAERNYVQARDLLLDLIASHGEKGEFLKEQARTLSDLGINQARTGRRADAEKSHTEALGLLEKLSAANPDVPEYQSMLADCCNSLGIIQADQGRSGASEQNSHRAREIYRRLAAIHPETTEFRVGQARVCSNLADDLYNANRLSEAERSLLEARALLRPLVQANPSEVILRSELARACLNLGEVLIAAGRLSEAEKSNSEARDLLERLVHDHSDVPDHRSDLAVVLANTGKLLAARGHNHEALAALERAIDLQRSAVERAPREESYRKFLDEHLSTLALVQMDLAFPANVFAVSH